MSVAPDDETIIFPPLQAKNTAVLPSTAMWIDLGFFDDPSHLVDSHLLEPLVETGL
jgi:hypothetical protein